jgi:DNA-binding HxlR family transcriptional regulator
MVTNRKKKDDLVCPVSGLLELIGGKWKPIILFYLRNDTRRFGEIAARIPNISRKVLTDQLKELERDNLVIREQFKEIPPRVEYRLSPMGQSLEPVLAAMAHWGSKHLGKK